MSKSYSFLFVGTVGEDIRHLLFSGPLSEEVDKEFSKLEKLMIRHTINNEQNYEEEMTIILYNTIANFRAVNFLWENIIMICYCTVFLRIGFMIIDFSKSITGDMRYKG